MSCSALIYGGGVSGTLHHQGLGLVTWLRFKLLAPSVFRHIFCLITDDDIQSVIVTKIPGNRVAFTSVNFANLKWEGSFFFFLYEMDEM